MVEGGGVRTEPSPRSMRKGSEGQQRGARERVGGEAARNAVAPVAVLQPEAVTAGAAAAAHNRRACGLRGLRWPWRAVSRGGRGGGYFCFFPETKDRQTHINAGRGGAGASRGCRGGARGGRGGGDGGLVLRRGLDGGAERVGAAECVARLVLDALCRGGVGLSGGGMGGRLWRALVAAAVARRQADVRIASSRRGPRACRGCRTSSCGRGRQ